jgi:16S rRNA processing protein RimM
MDTVYVAKLGKAVGLKGHVKLFIDSDFPEQFKKGARFSTNKNVVLIIEEYNAQRGIVKFETINDMDSAKKFTNTQLFSTYEQTKKECHLEENQFFWFDMMECEVYEENQLLGKVTDIHRYPTSDYLEITTDISLVQKELPQTFLIPYIKEYIISVDINDKKIQTKNTFPILENS